MERQMVINPQGARIERLMLGESLIFGVVQRGDGKTASSHPCTPIFGPETTTEYGLPQHGPMRNDRCTEIVNSPEKVILRYNIQAGDYPLGMSVNQEFLLRGSKNFALETIHTNQASEPLPVNFGEHFYWITPQGWKGLKINGEDVTQAVKNDSAVPLKTRNEIILPGLPPIILEQIGLPYANLWVYKNGNNFDQDYVCIEPVEGNPKNFFGSPDSLIEPNSFRKTLISLAI